MPEIARAGDVHALAAPANRSTIGWGTPAADQLRRGSRSTRRLAKTVPASVSPIVPPICWKNVRLPVATPIRAGATEFWTTSVKTANDGPIPDR